MKELTIARTLAVRRKEKGITQEELAAYVGVSKASVSKWETGQSYPDILLLPVLASYFNITIDELIGYSPQMTKEDIRRCYHRLAADFGTRPFDEVLLEVRGLIRKYYACFPLLLQMSVLILNHYMLAETDLQRKNLLNEVMELCRRIKNESEEVWLIKQANSMEAICQGSLNNLEEVIELLKGAAQPMLFDEFVLANAYLLNGNRKEAVEIIQCSIFQYLVGVIGAAPFYLSLYEQDQERFSDFLQKVLSVADTFDWANLHFNTMMQLCIAAAYGFMKQQNTNQALDMIERFADICCHNVESGFKLHGNELFDSIDGFIQELALGAKAPRDDKLIRDNLMQVFDKDGMFAPLSGELRFRQLFKRVETIMKAGEEKRGE